MRCVALLPVGLGAKGGEFNKVFIDTFQRIVLRGEPVRAVLDAEAEELREASWPRPRRPAGRRTSRARAPAR